MPFALVALLALLACACSTDRSDARPSSRERAAERPADEDEAPAESTGDGTELELAGIRASVPATFERLEGAARDRLERAAGRRDPGAEVAIVGAQPPGAPMGLVLMHIVHDPAYGAGFPVSESAADAEALAEMGAQQRGIGAETSSSCGERSCDVTMTLRGPGLTTSTRLRMWRDGGRLVEVGCQCVTAAGVDGCGLPCELPAPPATASVD